MVVLEKPLTFISHALNTLKPHLKQEEKLIVGKIKNTIVDKSYKVKKGIPLIDIVMPKVPKKESYYLKKKR